MLFWYLASELGWLLVPDPLLLPYLIIYDMSLIYVIALIYDIVSDRWGRTNRAIYRMVRNIIEAFQSSLTFEMAKFWERHRDGLPKSLQRIAKRLGGYEGRGRTFNRNVRRAYIGLIPILVFSFFAFRQVRLGQGETPQFALIEAGLLILLQIGVTIRFITLASREREPSGTR